MKTNQIIDRLVEIEKAQSADFVEEIIDFNYESTMDYLQLLKDNCKGEFRSELASELYDESLHEGRELVAQEFYKNREKKLFDFIKNQEKDVVKAIKGLDLKPEAIE